MSESRRLLVIDDDPAVCLSCQRILAQEGFEVDIQTDARQGLAHAIQHDYLGIVLDVRMPRLNGIEFLEELRRSKPNLPVLMLTGFPSVASAAAAVRLGAKDYITKPFTPEELAQAVRRMLRLAPSSAPAISSLWAGQTVQQEVQPGASASVVGQRLVPEHRMHVVVCVKMVPDTTQVKIDPVTNTLIRKDVPFITNPFDTRAVEEALRIKDKYGASVTALSMGPPAAEMVLRRAMSLGVDAAILLSDVAFGGADTLATSKVLAEAIKMLDQREPVDLIICGQQTIDGDTAQVGPGIACRLGVSQLTLVDAILKIDLEAKVIHVRRRLEQHYEVVEAPLPALLTVVREINIPRYPTVPGRLAAAEAPLPVWSNSTLKLEPDKVGLRGSPTQVKKIFAPQRAKGEIVEGEGEQKEAALKRVLEKLVDWDVVRLHEEA